MIRRFFIMLLSLCVLCGSVSAETIRWVDFAVPYESLKYAMDADIRTYETDQHISWIDTLALSACRTGGKCNLNSVKKAVRDLQSDKSVEELLGSQMKYYSYYHQVKRHLHYLLPG